MFKKGDPNINRRGRIASPIHSELRKAISERIDLQSLFTDIEELNPRDRVNATLKVLEFVLPKLSSVQTNELSLTEQIEALSKVETADLIDVIIQKHYDQ